MLNVIERRRYPRFAIPGGRGKFNKSGLTDYTEGFSDAFPILNISKGGAAFEPTDEFKPGKEFIFQLLAPEEPYLNLFSEVKRQTGFDGSKYKTVGIEFMPFDNGHALNSAESFDKLGKLEAKYGNITQPQITFNSELGVAYVIAAGALNNTFCLDIFKKAARIAEEHECNKVMCDFSDMTFTESVFNIYNLPSLARAENIPKFLEIAILYSSDEENFQFFENVCRNNGYNVSIFKDSDSVIEWLAERWS